MQITIIAVAVGLIALVGFFIWRLRQRDDFGFWDVVKNPELWAELIAGPDEAERRIAEAKSWPDEKVAAELENHVFRSKTRNGSWSMARALEELGRGAHAHVLRLLADESRREQLRTPTHPGDHNSLPETPFERGCHILEKNPPAEVIPLLAAFQSDADDEVRKHAALVIATVGTPDAIPSIRVALGDRNEFVRSYAILGMKRAKRAKCLDDRCQRELFADLEKLVDGKHYADDAAELLFEFHGLLGFERAIWDRCESGDESSLSPEQQNWFAVREIDSEINNGGLAQYFFNSRGDSWKRALAGFAAIGARERESILREAVARFPAGAPSESRSTRQGQLARLARETNDPFHDLDRRYFQSREIVDVALAMYVIHNAPAFR